MNCAPAFGWRPEAGVFVVLGMGGGEWECFPGKDAVAGEGQVNSCKLSEGGAGNTKISLSIQIYIGYFVLVTHFLHKKK